MKPIGSRKVVTYCGPHDAFPCRFCVDETASRAREKEHGKRLIQEALDATTGTDMTPPPA